MRNPICISILMLLTIGTGVAAAQCQDCTQGYVAIDPGKGSSADGRRIVTVAIDSSWDVNSSGQSSPGSGHTNPAVWNAVQAAMDNWNNATDQYGNKTGYYFEIDQTHQLGTPSITILNQQPSVSPLAENGTSDSTSSPTRATVINLAPNAPTVACTADDLAGATKHELGHVVGLNGVGSNTDCNSVINEGQWAYNSNTDSSCIATPYDTVSQGDVSQVNTALTSPSDCTGTAQTTSLEANGDVACAGDQPDASCYCDTSTSTWECTNICYGAAPNDTCFCDDSGSWECECGGDPVMCPDGTDALCEDGQWSCGSVSDCSDTPPTCSDGTVASCASGSWQCDSDPNGCDVCDPNCEMYDPSECGCDDFCDPSCYDYDPAECYGGGGGDCGESCLTDADCGCGYLCNNGSCDPVQ